jgi:hypothetical protein
MEKPTRIVVVGGGIAGIDLPNYSGTLQSAPSLDTGPVLTLDDDQQKRYPAPSFAT